MGRNLGAALAGLGAGLVNGIFGGAGGMLLVPGLQLLTEVEEDAIFPTSVTVMACVSTVSLALSAVPLPWGNAAPYLLGSLAGGVGAGLLGKRIPTVWLHRVFGAMILWGGIKYLW